MLITKVECRKKIFLFFYTFLNDEGITIKGCSYKDTIPKRDVTINKMH